jgi:hypothetical protein
MYIVFIGDVHGHNIWSKITEQETQADHFVFVGDYLDSLTVTGPDQHLNLLNIIGFKKQNPSKVTLLIGNHDYHYWPDITENLGTTSGFQSRMYHLFKDTFQKNKTLFQMCLLLDKYLVTHAGVSESFLKINGYYKYDSVAVDTFLNDLFFYKPQLFDFTEVYKHIDWVDSYGNNVEQSPIWIRPQSLQRANRKSFLKKSYIQIVGHTQMTSINLSGKTTGGKYVYIDTLPTNEYLISDNGILKVGLVK